MLGLQQATSLNRSATESIQTGNNMTNTNISYQASWPTNGLNATLSVQNSIFKNDLITTKNYGPTISVSKDVLKTKLKLMLSASDNFTTTSDRSNSTNTQILRLNCDYKIDKHQSLKFQNSYMRRFSKTSTGKLAPKELQANLSYQYTF